MQLSVFQMRTNQSLVCSLFNCLWEIRDVSSQKAQRAVCLTDNFSYVIVQLQMRL